MKQTAVFTFLLCILLCGCTTKITGEMLSAGEEKPPYSSSTDTEDSLEISNEVEDGVWPTAEEIRTTIAAEQVAVYWLADEMQMPEQMPCYSVAALELEAFWDTLREKLPNATGWVENGTLTMEDGAEQIQTILDALCEATGTVFTEVSLAEEDATVLYRYAQAINGVIFDTEGYTPGGGVEVIPGTRVDVDEDGRVSIQNPLLLGMETKTLSQEDLMRPEDVQALCTSYYQSYGLPCVTVVTGLEPVYYDAGGELCPAWRMDATWYPSENGHLTSQMVDGKTGEYLRQ